jgi:hypothetical protein
MYASPKDQPPEVPSRAPNAGAFAYVIVLSSHVISDTAYAW